MGIIRAEIIAKMRGAVKAGLSASRFIREMREVGLSYRRTDMLADYRRETGTQKKEGLLRFVRKDRYPTTAVMASLSPEASKEFLYKVKYQAAIRPDEPLKEYFTNIMSDVPMTPAMIEAEVTERWAEEEKYALMALKELVVWAAFGKSVE